MSCPLFTLVRGAIAALLLVLLCAGTPLAAHAGVHWNTPVKAIAPEGNHWQVPVRLTAPEGNHWQVWTPEHPLGQGLHLLAGTPVHDYGNLTPYSVSTGVTLTVPVSADLTRYDVPVGDQGYIGSCTSWAATYSLVGWYLNKQGIKAGPMAPMYTYHAVNGGTDGGSWAYLNLNQDLGGMIPLSQYSQGNYDWKTPATGTEMAIASHYRITGGGEVYQQVVASDTYDGNGGPAPKRADLLANARYSLEFALSHGAPLDVELDVYDRMYNATPQTAWVPGVNKKDALEGGHDLIAVGYDSRGLWVQNQWGTGWGLNGYAELSWDYVLDAVMDASVISGVKVLPGAPQAPVYHGAPQITDSIINGGTPAAGPLRDGREIAFAARGFKPGEVVSLYWDGVYRSYVETWNDGSFQLEWYDHHKDKTGPHNMHPAPGWHTIKAVGASGDWSTQQVYVSK